MHKQYDIIIIGAGIAGTGLAYELTKKNYKGKILIIDKEEPGANLAYGHRIIFEETLKKYNFPYDHIYKKINIGINDKTVYSIPGKFYFCNYKTICQHLLAQSKTEFKNETAKKLKRNILITSGNTYKFKYLIDCSGTNFFAKKQLKQKLPIRYWIGHVKTLENNQDLKDDELYYMFDESGYMEDFYPMKNQILQGDWQYTKKINFTKIKPTKNNLYKTIKNPKITKEWKVVDPVATAFPIIHKNIAFLGDSFSGGTPSAGVGIDPALEAAEMLTKALKLNNLKLYKKLWKKRFLNSYIKSLAFRLDRYHNNKLSKLIKKYPKNMDFLKGQKNHPELFLELCKNSPNFKLPKDLRNIFPRRQLFFTGAYCIFLKIKYELFQSI